MTNFYPVENTEINKEISYEQWGTGTPVSVLINSFLQNETVLNPKEDINVKLSIQNLFKMNL